MTIRSALRTPLRHALLAAALALAPAFVPAAPTLAAEPKSARSASPAGPAEQAQIARAEAWLNGLTTLRSRFIQVAPDGSTAQGTFSLSRPGRMRIDFDPPQENFIVADGRFVYFWDAETKEQSNAPIGSTLADVLLRPEIRLSGDVAVVAVTQADGLLELTLHQRDDPGLGRLTLVFEDKPFALRKWRVLDAQGLTTEVALMNPETGVALKDEIFFFRDPSRRKERD